MHTDSGDALVSTETRRILFICNVAWFFLSHRIRVAQAAQAAGFDVHVAADRIDASEEDALRVAGITFHRLHLSRGGLNPIRDGVLMFRLFRLIRLLHPDIVHNVTIKPVIYGSLAARAAGCPRVVNAVSGLGYVFAEEGRRGIMRAFVRAAYRLALAGEQGRVVFQNEDDAGQLLRQRVVDKSRVVLIRGSGVDLDAFSPVPESTDEVIVCLLPARMLRDKGIVEFAEAIGFVSGRGIAVRGVLAGGLDPANPAALSEAELLGLCARTGVEWLGHVSDMAKAMARAHIICLPSYREGLPKALIEACAAGRPIVATDVPGCRDVVSAGRNGLLVRPRDAHALADAIALLATDRKMRIRMGDCGRNRAVREFDVNRVVACHMDMYRELLQ